jgi:hypothetical protein
VFTEPLLGSEWKGTLYLNDKRDTHTNILMGEI